jgi:hypothetical protein
MFFIPLHQAVRENETGKNLNRNFIVRCKSFPIFAVLSNEKMVCMMSYQYVVIFKALNGWKEYDRFSTPEEAKESEDNLRDEGYAADVVDSLTFENHFEF